MHRNPCTRIPLPLVAILLGGALIVPQTASARAAPSVTKHRLDVTVHGRQNGMKITGTVMGSEGKGRVEGTSKPPKGAYRFTFRKGVMNLTSVGPVKGTKVTGTFKVRGGTRKYRGARGTGKMTGDVRTGVFRFAGTIWTTNSRSAAASTASKWCTTWRQRRKGCWRWWRQRYCVSVRPRQACYYYPGYHAYK